VSRPIRELVGAARRIAAGQYGAVVEMPRRDEIGELAETFNRMTVAVSEREEQLREGEERFRTMTESAVDAVVTADANENIVSWNRGAREAFGYSPEEVLGTPLARLVPSHLRQADEDGRERLAPTHVTPALERPVELHGVRKDGRVFPIELSLARWETRRGAFLTVIIRDITERRQLEEQFRQAQKMESIGRLAGGLAHDFNNLLTVISGYGHMIMRDLAHDDPLHSCVEEVLKAASRATSLTNQLLAFSRRQVIQPKILDLNALVANMDRMLRRVIGEHIELETVLSPGIGGLKADAGQLEQVIMNLAVNARDAMSEGGKLSIRTSNVDVRRSSRVHTDVRPGSYVRLTVADTGKGMDAEIMVHLFEPFYTSKETGKGTGLGLSTVYGIVKQSGGEIVVESEPGRGAIFNIYLPRITELTQRTPTTQGERSVRAGTETILLVEDELGVRQLVREMLHRLGYKIHEASNGADAVRIFSQHQNTIDLLLTDVIMPGMNGRDLATRFVAKRPNAKVVYMSGYTDRIMSPDGLLDSSVAFLQKPFKPEELARIVAKVLESK
jgi:PAS domain S-box-containing protein